MIDFKIYTMLEMIENIKTDAERQILVFTTILEFRK